MQITNEGLEHLTALTSLKTLGLYKSNVTDAGLVQLARLKSLVVLSLNNTEG